MDDKKPLIPLSLLLIATYLFFTNYGYFFQKRDNDLSAPWVKKHHNACEFAGMESKVPDEQKTLKEQCLAKEDVAGRQDFPPLPSSLNDAERGQNKPCRDFILSLPAHQFGDISNKTDDAEYQSIGSRGNFCDLAKAYGYRGG